LERIIGFDAQFLFDAFIMGVAMLILFALLSFLLFNPLKKVLNDRKERIAMQISSAQDDMTKAFQLKAEYEEKLRQVDKEANTILENARKKAKQNEDEIIKEAIKEAERIKDRAGKEVELEKKKVIDEIKNDFINISSLIASKAIGSSMSVELSSSLIEDTLKEIGESTWQS
jgi:hypothetical protein